MARSIIKGFLRRRFVKRKGRKPEKDKPGKIRGMPALFIFAQAGQANAAGTLVDLDEGFVHWEDSAGQPHYTPANAFKDILPAKEDD